MDINSNAIFIGWNRAHPGREKVSAELFGKFLGYLADQQKKGTITSFTPVSILPHGGDMNGFVLVQGENAKLSKLQTEETWNEFVLQGQVTLGGMGVLPAFAGEVVQHRLKVASKYW